MDKKEIAIIFNRANKYRRAFHEAEFATSRRESFARKHQAIAQVIADLGLTEEYCKQSEQQERRSKPTSDILGG